MRLVQNISATFLLFPSGLGLLDALGSRFLVELVVLDLVGDGIEQFLDSLVLLGAGELEYGPVLGGVLLRLQRRHLLGHQVYLVADDGQDHILGALLPQFLHPLLEPLEGGPAGHIVDDDGHARVPVVDLGDGPELVLAGRVPELELHTLAIAVVVHLLEVGRPQRSGYVLVELVVDEAGGQAGLAHAHRPDHHHLHLLHHLNLYNQPHYMLPARWLAHPGRRRWGPAANVGNSAPTSQYQLVMDFKIVIQYPLVGASEMSEKKTLQKCHKIMQLFERTRYGTAKKQERPVSKSTNLQRRAPEQKPRPSFYVPAQRKQRGGNLAKQSFNRSTSSVNSAKKSVKSNLSVGGSITKNFETVYNKQSRYDKIMKLKVSGTIRKKQDTRESYLNSSKVSLRSSASSVDRSKNKESRLDRIMKLKVAKPSADSTLKNYRPFKESRRIANKENIQDNSIVQLKKCKEIIRKQEKQSDKEDRLWRAFERERQMRLKQKQNKQKEQYRKERSLEKRFETLVEKQLKRIQLHKQINDRRELGFSPYLFPSY